MPTPILFLLHKRRGFTNQRASARGVGPLTPRMPLPVQPALFISGVTKDSAGSALADCTVDILRTVNDALVCSVTSDGSGNYVSNPVGLGEKFYAVAYKAGSPDVAGTTVNTLTGA